MVYTAPGWALLAGILAQHAALYRGISERSHPRLEPAGTTYDRAIEEISLPLPGGTSDRPPCQMTIVDHTFTSSMEQPYVAHFIPPIEQCPGPWDRVTLSFSSHVRGRQQDRVGGLWFDGVDVARFSTAQPNSNGIEWGFEKDLTAYQSLWQYPRPGQAEDKRHTVLVLRLDNEVDEVLTGAFGVNVKLTFWSKPLPSPLLSPSPMSVMLAPSETAVSLLGISPGQERLALPADPTVAPAVAPSTVAAATVAAAAATSSPAGDSVATKPTPAVVADANSAVAAPATTSSAASPSSSPSSEPSPVPDDLPPADLIEPLITAASKKDDARWTQLPMAAPVGRSVTVPERTSRAMLEIVPSAHGLEQTWFTEPPKAWGPLDRAAGGPVRTVEVWIDGVRHSTQPVFPAIAAGSINPLLWRPLACTGTFNAPTYWLDLSHVLVPGETHHVALQISSSRQHWLVSGNLHLWMDNTMQWIRVGHRGIVRGTAIPQAEFVTNETVSSSTSPEAHTIRITAEQNTSMTTSWIGVPSDAPPAVTRLIHTLAKKVASEPIFEMEDAPEDENQSTAFERARGTLWFRDEGEATTARDGRA
ncbi:hypothetical protein CAUPRSCDRAFT_11472 [Caulochytrium protostelioides]|uniref:Peptide N-acetyl-beta-D-glucosaminyl asparaginase amidase A N-terminal domain-containing protein n=1 Tax=Caulochytrium protostelioides TaxID=1555241 RepID=A0A4P9WU33_9FUNG|nr:hypothetical protein CAUPRSCDRAFT_11472 [Caulochytrium protostelioides]